MYILDIKRRLSLLSVDFLFFFFFKKKKKRRTVKKRIHHVAYNVHKRGERGETGIRRHVTVQLSSSLERLIRAETVILFCFCVCVCVCLRCASCFLSVDSFSFAKFFLFLFVIGPMPQRRSKENKDAPPIKEAFLLHRTSLLFFS